MISRTPLAATVVALLLMFAGLGAAHAEAPTTPPPAAAPAEPEPPPVITIGEVASMADALATHLGEIRRELDASDLAEQVREELEAFDSDVETAKSRLDATLTPQIRAGELNAVTASWESLNERLSTMESSLGKRATGLDEWLDEIQEADELWKRSRAEVRSASAPPAVISRVDEIRKQLGATKRDVQATRNAVLDLQAGAGKRRQGIESALDQLERAHTQLAAGLLTAQTPPIWAAWPDFGARSEGFERVSADLILLAQGLREYVAQHRVRLILHALLAVALGVLFVQARENVDEGKGDPDFAQSATLALARPRLAAFFFALFLTPYIQPDRVLGFSVLVYLSALPAWWLVVRGILPAPLHIPALGIALLTLSEILRITLGGFEFLARLLTLVEAGVGLAGVLWLRRPARLERLPELLGGLPWFRALSVWMRASALLFVSAFASEFLGYTQLADILILVPIFGSLSGAALVAMVLIAEAVARSLVDAGSFDTLRMVKARRNTFLAVIRRSFRLLGFAAWVYILLIATQLLVPLGHAVRELLGADIALGPLGLSAGSLLAFVLTLWISWLLSRFIAFTLHQEVFSRIDMPTGVPFALGTFARYTILVLGFLAAIAMLGFSMDKITLMVSALGVGIGFGLQNVVNNFVSGILLLFERPVRVGDMVELPELFGVVMHIGIRASTVRTFDGSDVIVPNADFISARVINWTLSDKRRRIILPVRASFGTDPERVLEVLARVATDHADLLDDPEPEALFRDFGESALDFELRVWTEGSVPTVRSAVAVSVHRALAEAGIETPYTQRNVTVRMEPVIEQDEGS